MTNNDVVFLMNSGIMAVSSRNLPLNSAYAVTKFKGIVEKAFKAWDEAFNKLPAEVEIKDTKAFDKRQNELTAKVKEGNLNNAEAKELDKMNETIDRLNELRKKLAEENVDVKVAPMPYEDWMTFKETNKDIKVGNAECLELAEIRLENVLWKAPENEE